MSMVQEIDYGTPAAAMSVGGDGDPDDRRPRCDGAGGHLHHARLDGSRHQGPQAVRHRHAGQLRQLPPVPGRDRGARRHAGLLHHPGRARHEGAHRQRQTSDSCGAG